MCEHKCNSGVFTANYLNSYSGDCFMCAFKNVEEIAEGQLSNTNEDFKLLSIQITNNPLKEITERAFSSLRELRYVDLAENKIHTVHAKAFAHQTSLVYLSLSSNPLTSLPASVAPSLRAVLIRSIDLETIPRTSFIGEYLTSGHSDSALYFDKNSVRCDCAFTWFLLLPVARLRDVRLPNCALMIGPSQQTLAGMRVWCLFNDTNTICDPYQDRMAKFRNKC